MTSLKFTLVGDTHVGKKLLLSHCDDSDFVENDRHSGVTIKGSVWENLTVNGKLNHLHLVNASCQTKHNNSNIAPNVLRVLCYARTDVFLVCFSVVNSASFENVKWVWIPEILELFGSRARILLVGMKADLRDDAVTLQRLAATRHRQISWLEAKQYAQAMQAISYVECSGNVKESVQTVLEEAVLAASKPDHATVVPVTLEPKSK